MHNDDSVMAFARESGGESDAAAYGEGNFGKGGGILGGGNTKVNIPAAGYLVLTRVLA
jgi:1,4-alpha-glucan branching enzyme